MKDVLGPGDVFAGYTIEAIIGEGGMGRVYRARHPRLPRAVALKMLSAAHTSDPAFVTRFEREADHAARVEHPNVVTVYDRGVDDEHPWISMQCIDGADAAALVLAEGPLAVDRAVYLISEIALGLDHAHSLGVLHRDVKPANIMVSPRPNGPERVLLADFGIAKAIAEETSLTESGTIISSLPFAAPEVLYGHPLDGRTDQYALAATLYTLLSGEPPFPGPNQAAIVTGHLSGQVPLLAGRRPDVPLALDAVIARGMAKDPAGRYADCAAFAAAARSALRAPNRPHQPGPPAVSLPPSEDTHIAPPSPTYPPAAGPVGVPPNSPHRNGPWPAPPQQGQPQQAQPRQHLPQQNPPQQLPPQHLPPQQSPPQRDPHRQNAHRQGPNQPQSAPQRASAPSHPQNAGVWSVPPPAGPSPQQPDPRSHRSQPDPGRGMAPGAGPVRQHFVNSSPAEHRETREWTEHRAKFPPEPPPPPPPDPGISRRTWMIGGSVVGVILLAAALIAGYLLFDSGRSTGSQASDDDPTTTTAESTATQSDEEAIWSAASETRTEFRDVLPAAPLSVGYQNMTCVAMDTNDGPVYAPFETKFQCLARGNTEFDLFTYADSSGVDQYVNNLPSALPTPYSYTSEKGTRMQMYRFESPEGNWVLVLFEDDPYRDNLIQLEIPDATFSEMIDWITAAPL